MQIAASALYIKIPAEINQRLARLADMTGRSKTFYAREAILEKLDDMEDRYLAESRLIAYRADSTRAIDGEVLAREYGVEY